MPTGDAPPIWRRQHGNLDVRPPIYPPFWRPLFWVRCQRGGDSARRISPRLRSCPSCVVLSPAMAWMASLRPARTIELNEPRVPIGELGFTEG